MKRQSFGLLPSFKHEVEMNEKEFHIYPIGTIKRSEGDVCLEILEPFRPALQQLEHFSHLIVLWWADKHDDEQSRSIMQTEPPYAQGRITGVFATRAEYRPNPIALTVCKITAVNLHNSYYVEFPSLGHNISTDNPPAPKRSRPPSACLLYTSPSPRDPE